MAEQGFEGKTYSEGHVMAEIVGKSNLREGKLMDKEPEVGDTVRLTGTIKNLDLGVALIEVYRSYPTGGTVSVQCGALEHVDEEANPDQIEAKLNPVTFYLQPPKAGIGTTLGVNESLRFRCDGCDEILSGPGSKEFLLHAEGHHVTLYYVDTLNELFR